MEEVLLAKHPKLPIAQVPSELDQWATLEAVEAQFYEFIGNSFSLALKDAERNIVLNDATLHP